MEKILAYGGEVCQGGTCEGVNVDPGTMAAIMTFVMTFIGFIIIFATITFAFWVWMLMDAFKRTEAEYQKIGSGEKNLWLVLMLVSLIFGFWFLVSIIYYFVIYRTARKKVPPVKGR
ncbi:hypothetical protein K0A96_01035 [Patescibacteria group bacterium]|nr:hypothetical protein [Patescibacteria group bacterium]